MHVLLTHAKSCSHIETQFVCTKTHAQPWMLRPTSILPNIKIHNTTNQTNQQNPNQAKYKKQFTHTHQELNPNGSCSLWVIPRIICII